MGAKLSSNLQKSNETLKNFLQTTNRINEIDKKNSILHYLFFYKKNDELIDSFLDRKPNVKLQNGKTVLHVALENNFSNSEIIEKILKLGFDLDIRDNDTVLHIACWKGAKKEIVEILIKYGADVNAHGNTTPLHDASKCKKTNLISILLDNGADINSRDNDTPLHITCKHSGGVENITELLRGGADVFALNDQTPQDLANNQEMKAFLQFHMSFVNDFLQFFKRGEFTDSQVETIEEPVKFHKQVFNFRLSTVSLEKLGDVCQKQHKEDVVNFFSWIYSGIANNKFSIKNILKELGVKEEDFESKSGKNGLISDFKKLFEDDDSKEFRIVVEEKEVKIHKFVLIARTDLFRGMFLNVVDDSNFVGEYSGRCFDTIKHFVRFLYFDELGDEVSDQVLEELEDAIDYYQLNENSFLPFDMNLKKRQNIIKKKMANNKKDQITNEKEKEKEKEKETKIKTKTETENTSSTSMSSTSETETDQKN